MPLLTQDFVVLQQDGCLLADTPPVFMGLMATTNNDPCTTGCAFFDNGKCTAYRKHHTDVKRTVVASLPRDELIGGKWKGMTTKQIIDQEKISRGEFQKRKNAGQYKE